MAIQFLNKWGCEVTAFSSNPSKRAEILAMGAHHVVSSRDRTQMENLAGRFHFVMSTVNVTLDWQAVLGTLAPRGNLHFAGAVAEPISFNVFSAIGNERTITASPTGTPETILQMIEFCTRHGIAPITENFPMTEANEALAHLHAGKARYRIVLHNDLR
jgi:uncharacterized zinc-type alcohol dehydrogenase-like protein